MNAVAAFCNVQNIKKTVNSVHQIRVYLYLYLSVELEIKNGKEDERDEGHTW